LTTTGRVSIRLEAPNDDFSLFSQPIIDVSRTLTLSHENDFYDLFHDLAIDLATGKVTVVETFNFDKSLENLAAQTNVGLTGNAKHLSGLMSDIKAEGQSPALTKKLQDIFYTISDLLGTDPDDAQATFVTVLKQLAGESLLGLNEALTYSAYKSQGVVLNRLDRIFESGLALPPAAGEADVNNRLWADGFGSWACQKNKDSIDGYDFDGSGLSLGYDRHVASQPGLSLGAPMSFSFGKIKSNNGLAAIDSDTVALGLYGSYLFSGDFFVDVTASYGVTSMIPM
jgi:outer membrane autotransporter protein